MLNFSTSHKTLDITVDGAECHIPLQLTLADIERVDILENAEASSMEAVKWFVSFLKPYVVEVEKLSIDDLSSIMSEWNKMRVEAGEVEAGE